MVTHEDMYVMDYNCLVMYMVEFLSILVSSLQIAYDAHCNLL